MKPNILYLSADNLGDNEIGAVGQKILKTIQLNKLSGCNRKLNSFHVREVMLTRENLTKVPIILFEVQFQNDKQIGDNYGSRCICTKSDAQGGRFLNKFIYNYE